LKIIIGYITNYFNKWLDNAKSNQPIFNILHEELQPLVGICR